MLMTNLNIYVLNIFSLSNREVFVKRNIITHKYIFSFNLSLKYKELFAKRFSFACAACTYKSIATAEDRIAIKMASNNMFVRSSRNLTTPSVTIAYNHDDFVHPENVVTIITGILSVFANSFLLYVMYKDPLKVFRAKISYLVVCLAISDFLTAVNGVLYGFLQPLNMYHIGLWYIIWATVLTSVLTVFGMCVERWLAILYPFISGSICTKRLTQYFCIGVWILSAGVASSIHFLPRIMPFILTCLMEVFLLLIVVLYIMLLHYFRRTQRRTCAVEKVRQYKQRSNDEEANIGTGKRKSTKVIKQKAALETQLLIAVSILVLILFVTFIPYNLGTQIHFGYLLFTDRPHPKINIFLRYFFPVKFLNFLVNPFVYAWRLDHYRKSFMMILYNWGIKRMTVHNVSPKTTKQTCSASKDATTKQP